MVNLNKFVPSRFSYAVSRLDVYVTDEANFVPYKSVGNLASLDSAIDSEDTFTLHQGKILETITFDNLYSCEWNKDYSGLSGDGTVTLPYHKEYLKYLYRGVRCLLRVERISYGGKKTYPDSFLCFITDVKIGDSGINISLSAFEKLLERTEKMEYSQMYRSQILKEVIKSAGLVPVVDVSGLRDEKIDWTNITESSSGSDDGSTGDGTLTWDKTWEIQNSFVHYYRKSGCLTHTHDPETAWKAIGTKKGAVVDCFSCTAWLYYVLNNKVGVKTRQIKTSSSTSRSGTHFFVNCYQNGEWSCPSEYSGGDTYLKCTNGGRGTIYQDAP